MAVKNNNNNNNNNINILIVGGGTGGHISPGLALYEEFSEKGIKTVFLTGNRDKRFSSLNDVDKNDLIFYGAPPLTRNIFKIPFFIIKFLFAILKAVRILKNEKISAVIGMGGYVSGPVLIAARIKKVSIYLCEQNSVPGKVTMSFEKHARKIYGTFDVSKEYLEFSDKYFHAGNPIRKSVFEDVTKSEAKREFNLDHARKVILAIGGSQGAMKINELILDLKKTYPVEFKDIGLIWSTGDYLYDKYKDMIHNEEELGAIYMSPFIDKVGTAYRASDIAISRSGAGVMMELAAMGLPSIQVPYPYAAMDHQDKNADVFVKEGAAVKISDSEANAKKVGPVLFSILNNSRTLKNMSERSFAVAKKDAAEVIVKDIIKDFNVL